MKKKTNFKNCSELAFYSSLKTKKTLWSLFIGFKAAQPHLVLICSLNIHTLLLNRILSKSSRLLRSFQNIFTKNGFLSKPLNTNSVIAKFPQKTQKSRKKFFFRHFFTSFQNLETIFLFETKVSGWGWWFVIFGRLSLLLIFS